LRSEDAVKTISELKKILDENSGCSQSDVKTCLVVKNWRPNLIACVSMILTKNSDNLPFLWLSIESGNWVSPQLCIAAFLIDQNFEENALITLSKDIDDKTRISLSVIMMSCFSGALSTDDIARYQYSIKSNLDNVGRIMSSWLERINNIIGLERFDDIESINVFLKSNNY